LPTKAVDKGLAPMPAASPDVIFGWLVPVPTDAPEPDKDKVLLDIGDTRDEMRRRMVEFCNTQQRIEPLHIDLNGDIWGLAGTMQCKSSMVLFMGLCEAEGQEDGADYLTLGTEEALGDAEMVLLKQELFCAIICRVWGRQLLYDAVKPLLVDNKCPFDVSGQIVIGSDEDVSNHYLELLQGQGPKEQCPQAEKYLKGVARDLILHQQPCLCKMIAGRGTIVEDDSILNVFAALDEGKAKIPRDQQGDLALAVATKALELVQVLGLDL